MLGLDLRGISDLKGWVTLQKEPINIEWRDYNGFPISKANSVLDYDITLIANAIQDLDNYPNIFKRVTKTRRINNDIVQIVLDMPFPFSGRDYIIQYTIENNNDNWIFSFKSVKNPSVKIESDHVRLPNAAGVWILSRLSKNKTSVTYAWNGELLGNFPDFGLERAWITQGTEVLHWLDESLSNKLKS